MRHLLWKASLHGRRTLSPGSTLATVRGLQSRGQTYGRGTSGYYCYWRSHHVGRALAIGRWTEDLSTQQWKRTRLHELGVELPSNVTLVPLDFEKRRLIAGLHVEGYRPQDLIFLMAGRRPLSDRRRYLHDLTRDLRCRVWKRSRVRLYAAISNAY